jgi:hypothetical protein
VKYDTILLSFQKFHTFFTLSTRFLFLNSGLLRLTELEGGVIAIDGVDVSAVGLNALRYSNSDEVSFASLRPILPNPDQSILPYLSRF